METADLIGLAVPVTYFVFLLAEKLWPAREFPPRPAWQWIGAGFLVMVLAISTIVPLLIPESWMAEHRWIDGTQLGIAGGTVVGVVVLELVIYAWHRMVHHVSFMWRGFHQMHHSPQRVDIAGSLVFHPAEVVAQVLQQLFVTVIVLGLDPVAAALTGYVIALFSFFQHWNVHTPKWIGYVVQRPESHCVHHRLGLHYYNFADLPFIDMVFGTFRNPAKFMGDCGFEAPSDRKLGAILAFADVNERHYGPGSRGVRPSTGQSAG
ncbi:MAG TPA: sterol desaturase family protein [Ramlibacter sp.]|nr:sterol desaturase family protein [Ramlibacter sp.]